MHTTKCPHCNEDVSNAAGRCYRCGNNLVPEPARSDADSVRVQRMGMLLARWREDARAMMIFADESDSPEREECIERAKVLNDCADEVAREMAGEQHTIQAQR